VSAMVAILRFAVVCWAVVGVQTAVWADPIRKPVRSLLEIRQEGVIVLPAQPVDATQALNLSAGVSNPKVSRGRSLS